MPILPPSLLAPRALASPPARAGMALLVALVFASPLAAGPLAGATPPPADPAAEAHDPSALREDLRRLIGDARDRVFPALVSIRAVTVQYHQGKELKGQAVGSGTIVSADGHVLTNEHVVRNGSKFFCTLSDKREVKARLVGSDPLTDLAVLQLDLIELDGAAPNLPVATLGRSSELEVGDYVMAMGSPFSLSRSVSLGIVSNTERVFAGGFGSDDVGEMELEEGQRTGLFTRWIQHDALILPGNSGGPLVNLAGEVVGINELGNGAMGFAIPSELARRVADALIAQGEVPRSTLGVSFKPIQRTGLEEGVLISSVVVGEPAAMAGIEAGDVLLAIDGAATTVRFVEEVPLLSARIADLPIGSRVALEVRHGDAVREVEVTTVALQKDVGEEESFHAWGLSAQEITPKMAHDRRLEDTRGALVTGVRQGGPAQTAEPPIQAGDVVRSIDRVAVADLAALIERYAAMNPIGQKAEPFVVELDRQGKSQLTLVQPRSDDPSDPPRELPKAWIGVATQPVLPDLAKAVGLEGGGFRITRVYPRTEAAKTDLAVGDVIVSVDGEAVVPAGMQDAGLLTRRVRRLDIGGTAVLGVLRDGVRHDVPVPLERTRIGPEEARHARDRDFEIGVREVTFFDRDENRWGDDVAGVLLVQVEPGGWGGLGGLQPLDLVQRVDGKSIDSIDAFRAVFADLARRRPARVEVVVLRGARTHFQYLEPDWVPEADGE